MYIGTCPPEDCNHRHTETGENILTLLVCIAQFANQADSPPDKSNHCRVDMFAIFLVFRTRCVSPRKVLMLFFNDYSIERCYQVVAIEINLAEK